MLHCIMVIFGVIIAWSLLSGSFFTVKKSPSSRLPSTAKLELAGAQDDAMETDTIDYAADKVQIPAAKSARTVLHKQFGQ